MERLTFLNGDEVWCVDNNNCFEEQSEHYCGPAIDRLAYYEDMEEQGRLVVLPCKVGDTLFFVRDGEIYSGVFRYAHWENHKDRGVRSEIRINTSPYATMGASFDDIGKTVFLTREEAEQALEGGADSGDRSN